MCMCSCGSACPVAPVDGTGVANIGVVLKCHGTWLGIFPMIVLEIVNKELGQVDIPELPCHCELNPSVPWTFYQTRLLPLLKEWGKNCL